MQLLLTIMICVVSLAASCAVAYSVRAFGASRPMKRMRDLEQQIADLTSSFDSLMESHKTLRSRAGMRELRERRKGGDKLTGELSEQEIAAMKPSERKLYFRRQHFAGMDHRAFALKQQQMDRAPSQD